MGPPWASNQLVRPLSGAVFFHESVQIAITVLHLCRKGCVAAQCNTFKLHSSLRQRVYLPTGSKLPFNIGARMQHAKSCPEPEIFGFTPSSFVQSSPERLSRNLSVVEVFCGVASIFKAAVAYGVEAAGVDKKKEEAEDEQVAGGEPNNRRCLDVTNLAGFSALLWMVMAIKEGGLLTLAPECSSFIGACAAQHQRSRQNDWLGDTSRDFVTNGNFLATVTAFLVCVGTLRNLVIVIENPTASCIWNFPVLADAIAWAQIQWHALVPRCAFDVDTPLGKRYGKVFRFVADAAWIKQLHVACPCGSNGHKPTSVTFVQKPTPRAKVSTIGSKRWSGIKKNMEESGRYPPLLGQCMVSLWAGHGLPAGANLIPRPDEKEQPKKQPKKQRVARQVKQKALKRPASAVKKKPASKMAAGESEGAIFSWLGPASGADPGAGVAHDPEADSHSDFSWLMPDAGVADS